MLAHMMGIPVEESVLQLAPAGAAIVTAVAIAGRTTLGRHDAGSLAAIHP
jgi:hypothetical protein